MANHVLKGSERKLLPGARSLGKADPAERLEVSVLVRRRAADALRDRVKKVLPASGRPEHLKREDFAQHTADRGSRGHSGFQPCLRSRPRAVRV